MTKKSLVSFGLIGLFIAGLAISGCGKTQEAALQQDIREQIDGLTVSPSSVSLEVGATQKFTVSGLAGLP